MASPTTAAAPDAPSGSSPLSINGQPRLVGWFQEICTNFLKLLSPSGASVYDTGWVDITLNTGFAAGSGASPQVRRIGKVVYVRGQVTTSSGNFSTGTDLVVGTIPAGFRPNRSWADRFTPLWPNPTLNTPIAGSAYSNGSLVIRVPTTVTAASSVSVGPVGPYPVD